VREVLLEKRHAMKATAKTDLKKLSWNAFSNI
jgi:hypothetical protein